MAVSPDSIKDAKISELDRKLVSIRNEYLGPLFDQGSVWFQYTKDYILAFDHPLVREMVELKNKSKTTVYKPDSFPGIKPIEAIEQKLFGPLGTESTKRKQDRSGRFIAFLNKNVEVTYKQLFNEDGLISNDQKALYKWHIDLLHGGIQEYQENWLLYPHLVGSFSHVVELVEEFLFVLIEELNQQILDIKEDADDSRKQARREMQAKSSLPKGSAIFAGGLGISASSLPPSNTQTPSSSPSSPGVSLNPHTQTSRAPTASQAISKKRQDVHNVVKQDLQDIERLIYSIKRPISETEMLGVFGSLLRHDKGEYEKIIKETWKKHAEAMEWFKKSDDHFDAGGSKVRTPDNLSDMTPEQKVALELKAGFGLGSGQNAIDPQILQAFHPYAIRKFLDGERIKEADLAKILTMIQKSSFANSGRQQELIEILGGYVSQKQIELEGNKVLVEIRDTAKVIEEGINANGGAKTTDDKSAIQEIEDVKELYVDLAKRTPGNLFTPILSLPPDYLNRKKEILEIMIEAENEVIAQKMVEAEKLQTALQTDLQNQQIAQWNEKLQDLAQVQMTQEQIYERYMQALGELDEQQRAQLQEQYQQAGIMALIEQSVAEAQQQDAQQSSSQGNNASRISQVQNARKKMQRMKQVANLARLAITSPAAPFVVGGGLAAGGMIAAAMQGAGTLLGSGIGMVAGGGVGAGIGFALGGIPGMFVGGVIGGGIGSVAPQLIPMDLIHRFFPDFLPNADGSLAQAGGESLLQSLMGQNTILPSISQSASNLAGAGASVLPEAASTASTTASGLAKSALGNAGNAIGNGLTGSTQLLSQLGTLTSSVPTAIIIPGVTGGTIAMTMLISGMILPATFLTPDELFDQGNEHISITKVASPNYAENPEPVTYTITVRPKDPYTITITDAKDIMSVQKDGTPPPAPVVDQNTLNQLNGPLPTEGKTITYTIPYGVEFDDSRIINSLTVTYNATSAEGAETTSFTVSAAVAFGDAPSVGGCWPVTGQISQMPFAIGSYSHENMDSFDIDPTEGRGAPVKAPYAGTVYQFRWEEGESPNASDDWSEAGARWGTAGRLVVLHTDLGYDFMFQHLEGFEGTEGRVEAGAVIGYVGDSGNSDGVHLHYEVRRTWNELPACYDNCAGTASLIATLVPPDENGDAAHMNSQVSDTKCSAGSGELPTELTRVGCYSFRNSSKNWAPDEIEMVSAVLEDVILSNATIRRAVCMKGGAETTILLSRVSGSPSDAGGSWAAQVPNDSEIQFNDNLFSDTAMYGRSTVIHEQGHIIHFRHPSNVTTNFPQATYETDDSLVATYPYRIREGNEGAEEAVIKEKFYKENFGEAFGLCTSARYTPDQSYRQLPGAGIVDLASSTYQNHCVAITSTLNSIQ